MDVAAWSRDRLVDGISPGCYNTDFRPAVEAWRALLGDSMPVHAYFNCGPDDAVYMSLENYRAAAANAHGAGADGVYLFNFPCLDELSNLLLRPADQSPQPPVPFHAQCWHPDLVRTRQALHELGDPAALAGQEQHYRFYTGSQKRGYRHMTQDVASISRVDRRPAEMSFRCYTAADAGRIVLKLKAVNVTSHERFSFTLNGAAIPGERIEHLYAPAGRDARIHSVTLLPYSQFVFTLPPEAVRRGDNTLTVSLDRQEPDLTGRIDLVEMELLLGHKEKP